MQAIEEAIVGYYLDNNGCFRRSLRHCASRVDFPHHWSRFSYKHKSDVILYGVPDEIFKRKDGSICVVDHKTAKSKGKEDPFHEQYHVQVCGYGNIAELGLGLGKVSLGGLLYWEIQTDDVKDAPSDYYTKGIVSVPFVPKPLEVEIDYSILDPLLKEAQRVWEASTPPEGREECKDCIKLDLLFGIEQQIEGHDAQLVSEYAHAHMRNTQNEVEDRRYWRLKRRFAALKEIAQHGEAMFEADGMGANWEFPVSSVDQEEGSLVRDGN
jgi:hypothetical protein